MPSSSQVTSGLSRVVLDDRGLARGRALVVVERLDRGGVGVVHPREGRPGPWCCRMPGAGSAPPSARLHRTGSATRTGSAVSDGSPVWPLAKIGARFAEPDGARLRRTVRRGGSRRRPAPARAPGRACVAPPAGPHRVSTEVQATRRNRSCAWRLTVSTRSAWLSPGISTTIRLLPWVVTSASVTPRAVDAVVDDRRGLVEPALLDVVLGDQGDAGAALEVEAQLRRPGADDGDQPVHQAQAGEEERQRAPRARGLACHVSSPLTRRPPRRHRRPGRASVRPTRWRRERP